MGYRGYIFSRVFMGERVPQHIQNIVIRDYCAKRNICFLLSVTEYGMENSYLILNQIVEELAEIDGIVCYSLFQLPVCHMERNAIIRRVLDAGKSLHFAVESLSIIDDEDHSRIDDIMKVRQTLPYCFLSKEVV